MPFLASEGCFWPLTASKTFEVKNTYVYGIMQDIYNKFIGVKFLCGMYEFTAKSSVTTFDWHVSY